MYKGQLYQPMLEPLDESTPFEYSCLENPMDRGAL